jgi:hypothetical protein
VILGFFRVLHQMKSPNPEIPKSANERAIGRF